mgnify:CR=1 FL=1
METKDLVLLMLIPIILVSLVIYTDTGPAITGAVVNEPAKESNIIGTYSINPSFKAKEKYDLDDYNKIKELLDVIMSCAKQNSVEQCVAQINDNEFAWQLGCDKGAEKVLYDFAEFFQDCIDSEDNNCICTKNLELSSEKIKEYGLLNTFDLILNEPSQNKIKIEVLKSEGLSYGINTNGLSGWIPSRYVLGYDSNGIPKLNLFFYDLSKGDDFKGPGPLTKLIIYKNNLNNINTIDFVKQENDNLKNPRDNIIMDKDNKPVEVSKLPNCNIKPKNTYKLCVMQKNYKITAYDKLDGQVKERSPVVKFAAYIAPAQNP